MTTGGSSVPTGPGGHDGPHVLVADVAEPVLAGSDRHHLERVLRLRPGSPLTVGDGAGRWRGCAFGPELEPVSEIVTVASPDPTLTVAFSLIKGGRPELIVQKLTEAGIDRIAPIVAERSVVRWDDAKATRNGERWRRIAREAAMQCRRAWLPEVLDVGTFAELVAGDAALADPDGEPLSRADRTVLIGPEGGWTDAERTRIGRRVRLGAHVLRAETAAIAAGTLMVALREGLIAPVADPGPT